MRKNFTLRINLDLQRKNYLKAFKSYEKKIMTVEMVQANAKQKRVYIIILKIELINEFIGGAI